MQLLFPHHVVHSSFTSSGCSQTSKKINFLKTGVSNPNGRLQRFGAKGTLRATLGQVRSSSLFPILLLLSVFLFTAVTQALSCPCSCLAARAGAGNSKLPYRCQGLLQREGRLWLSQVLRIRAESRDTSFAGVEEEKKVVEEDATGGVGVYARVKHCGKSQAVIQQSFCSPLCSLLVSYAAHSVPRLSSALPVLLWQGHPGSAFERYYDWKNWSRSVKPAMHQQFMRCKRPI